MASTFSNLKIELIATGEQSGTWGSTTNTNLGTAIEQAITGSVDITFASSDVTLTLTDTNAAQNARALRLNLTGTSGGARNLIVPAIAKQYIVNNGLADAVTVKNSTGTGIAVPAGKTMVVFNNATNVVDVTTYASSLTLGAALPITSGGTGTTSTTFVNLATNVTGTLPVANGGTGQTTASAAFNALSPITTTGDLIIGNGSNSATRLGIGTNGYILTSNGTTATWSAAPPSGATISNDTSTATNLYPLFANATSGSALNIYTSNAKLLYKPSTGELQASQLVASNGLVVNSTTVSASYTIATGTNAMSVGPITVASGQSVTVSSGQRWVVI
jgi:hypothetical protein